MKYWTWEHQASFDRHNIEELCRVDIPFYFFSFISYHRSWPTPSNKHLWHSTLLQNSIYICASVCKFLRRYVLCSIDNLLTYIYIYARIYYISQSTNENPLLLPLLSMYNKHTKMNEKSFKYVTLPSPLVWHPYRQLVTTPPVSWLFLLFLFYY